MNVGFASLNVEMKDDEEEEVEVEVEDEDEDEDDVEAEEEDEEEERGEMVDKEVFEVGLEDGEFEFDTGFD